MHFAFSVLKFEIERICVQVPLPPIGVSGEAVRVPAWPRRAAVWGQRAPEPAALARWARADLGRMSALDSQTMKIT